VSAPARAAALALAAAACSAGDGAPKGLGKRVFDGPVRALSAAPDGAWLALLDGCAEVKGQALPPQTASCDLKLVPASGEAGARKVASAVTTLPQGVLWAPRGHVLAALSEYDYVTASGKLLMVAAGEGAVEPVADGVTFQGFGSGTHALELAAVARGRLVAKELGTGAEPLPGAEGVASFEVHPDAGKVPPGRVALLARQAASGGGALLGFGKALARPASDAAATGAPVFASRIAERAGDYAFAPRGDAYAYTVLGRDGYELFLAGAGAGPARLAAQVHGFAFARDGTAIAFVAGAAPGTQGDLFVSPVAAPKPARFAREVGEFRWARDAARLAWLEKYDPRVRAGTLGAGGPGLAPRALASNVSDLEISPDGEHLAFLQHTTRGGYSVDLALAHLSAPPDAKPASVAQGVFGFAFSPDGAFLYYRTRCTRNAEACDLERVPATGPAPGAAPEKIADGVKSFEFDPRDPARLLVTWQRKDMVALDVAVWERGKLTSIDTAVLPGSARFLGPDSRRVAYVVAAPKRQGVYVAELPR
jgi:hypothetical protein